MYTCLWDHVFPRTRKITRNVTLSLISLFNLFPVAGNPEYVSRGSRVNYRRYFPAELFVLWKWLFPQLPFTGSIRSHCEDQSTWRANCVSLTSLTSSAELKGVITFTMSFLEESDDADIASTAVIRSLREWCMWPVDPARCIWDFWFSIGRLHSVINPR